MPVMPLDTNHIDVAARTYWYDLCQLRHPDTNPTDVTTFIYYNWMSVMPARHQSHRPHHIYILQLDVSYACQTPIPQTSPHLYITPGCQLCLPDTNPTDVITFIYYNWMSVMPARHQSHRHHHIYILQLDVGYACQTPIPSHLHYRSDCMTRLFWQDLRCIVDWWIPQHSKHVMHYWLLGQVVTWLQTSEEFFFLG